METWKRSESVYHERKLISDVKLKNQSKPITPAPPESGLLAGYESWLQLVKVYSFFLGGSFGECGLDSLWHPGHCCMFMRPQIWRRLEKAGFRAVSCSTWGAYHPIWFERWALGMWHGSSVWPGTQRRSLTKNLGIPLWFAGLKPKKNTSIIWISHICDLALCFIPAVFVPNLRSHIKSLKRAVRLHMLVSLFDHRQAIN